ncbi:uncharacterized protein LOC114288956 isoform X1 [Camellia sinensis]|uniref:uncharacterized protein LOC114288956 isoform X1 n=1 Tax=Camellia sinensis TaxID=4442 RepID=UPI00103698BD|nr:uncharacterized protein LOC114288956 isoform X1 [Camellia sinensis]
MLESLAWEKWPCFSNNRFLEEAKKSSKPGLVAQRKAYFEALYNRNGAKKPAALLEEQNAACNEPNVMEETSRDSSNPPRIPTRASANGLSVHSSTAPQEERRRSKPVDDCSVQKLQASANGLSVHSSTAPQEERRRSKPVDDCSVSRRRIADGKSHGIDHLKTSGVSGPKARRPTVPSPFSLRCEDRAAKRKEFFQKLEEKTNAKILVSGRRIADGKSHGIDHLKTSGVSGPKARRPTVPSPFSLRCEDRAAKRKEFFQKLEEKTNAKILVSGRRIADGKSHGIDHLKTSGVSGPKARPPTVPSSFSLRCEERAAKRKEFFQKLEEKTNAKEANKVYLQAKNKISLTQPMQVKMKLVNLGHAQSEETRMKIGIGVRMGWERRREKLKLQETCYFEWQNLIAEASRKGFVGEEEKQWNSYKILDEQLEQEWLESVEQRRKMARPKGSKRAPKSLEQRRKISEAISAKWADPVRAYVAFSAENAYRDRVCTALHKYHGTPVGAERKPKRRPRSSERQPRIQNPTKKKANDTDNSTGNVTESQKRRTRLRSNMPLFKDPLASSKLEMIKNIRAERAAAETKKTEAIERAKLLIAEAEKAAKALEAAATKSPLAQASLIETRNLIAEAIQSIQSIEIGQIDSHGNGRHPSIASAELVNQAEKGNNPGVQGLSQRDNGEINGTQTVESSKSDYNDFGFGKFNFHDLLNGKEELYQTSMSDYGLPPSELDGIIKQCSFTEQLSQLELNGNGAEYQSRKEETPPNSIPVAKKWVRGRLVEVVDGD